MCIYLQGSLAPAAEHKPWINQHCFFLPNDQFNLKISQKSDDFFILELKHLEQRRGIMKAQLWSNSKAFYIFSMSSFFSLFLYFLWEFAEYTASNI